MGSLTLGQCTVSNKIFNQILNSFPSYVKTVSDLRPYMSGCKEKNTIYYDGKEYLICTESILNYIVELADYTPWKQLIIRNMPGQEEDVIKDVTGTSAWNYMMNNIILKFYSKEEFTEILKSYDNKYNEELKQYHDINFDRKDYIINFKNCYAYDINGAHTDALVEMFPKAADKIIKFYNKRATNSNIKLYFNYFVGMFKHKGYEGAYNWIVQRTTTKLFDSITATGGTLIYANTDGYIVQEPDHLQSTSTKLGEFKLESQGDVYCYRDKNYWAIQYVNNKGKKVLKGNVLSEVRKDMDLSKGQVVHYKKEKNAFDQYYATEITMEVIKIENY